MVRGMFFVVLMYFALLCEKCFEIMREIHSGWISDGEAHEKTLKCPTCKNQVAIAIPFYEKLEDWKNTKGVIKPP